MKCCDFKASELRIPATLQHQVEVDIGGGAKDISYSTYDSTRVAFKALSGSERLYAQRIDAVTRNRLKMRYRADLVESDRILIDGRAYNVTFVDNVEMRNRWLLVDIDGGVPV